MKKRRYRSVVAGNASLSDTEHLLQQLYQLLKTRRTFVHRWFSIKPIRLTC